MKKLIPTMIALLITSCGVDTSSDPKPTSCQMSVMYSSAEKGTSGFDIIKYTGQLNESCQQYLKNESTTKVSVRVDVIGSAVNGYLKSIAVDNKTISLLENDDKNYINGASFTFVELYSEAKDSNMYLPWDLQSNNVVIEISVPTQTKPESYPKTVKLEVSGI